MKKRGEWLRKALKRERKENYLGIVDLMMIMYHFFKELSDWINETKDPRHPSYGDKFLLLNKFQVKSDFRRKGIGRELLSCCIKYALRDGASKIKVYPSSEAWNREPLLKSQEFYGIYEKPGFHSLLVSFWDLLQFF